MSTPQTPPKKPRRKVKKNSLSTAVRAIESRLVAAIKEREKAAQEWTFLKTKFSEAQMKYSMKNAEIMSLQQTLAALHGHHGGMLIPAIDQRQVDLTTIMSDTPIPSIRPPMAPVVAQSVPMTIEGPDTPPRAGGGAIDVSFDDDDQHLREAGKNLGSDRAWT